MVQNDVDTNKHEDFNLMFTNHRKRMEYQGPKNPLNRDSKSPKQRSIIKIYCKKHAKTPKKEFVFSTYWRHNNAILKMKLNHLSISIGQGNQLVPLLPSAP